MHLYLRDSPRSLILATHTDEERQGLPSRCLVVESPEHGSSQTVVKFLPKTEVNFESAIRLSSRNILGCLGLINVADDIFVVTVVSATDLGNLLPGAATSHNIARIQDVAFYCVNSPAYDHLDGNTSTSASTDQDYNFKDSSYLGNTPPSLEHPCGSLRKLVSSGTFYYSPFPQWDLSNRLTDAMRTAYTAHDMGAFNDQFIWNEYLVASLLDFREQLEQHEQACFDRCQFIILAIQGFAGICTVALPAPPTNGAPVIATLGLISRLSCKRAGTRFNTRGIDDDGNCANFVESELLFSTDDLCFSHVQVRGSVPLFWEQQGLQTFGQRIQITRSQLASQPAFERHFSQLQQEYFAVHGVNLLGTKENETILSSAYSQHLRTAQSNNAISGVGLTHFDFHTQVRERGHDSLFHDLRGIRSIKEAIDHFGFTSCDLSLRNVVTEQKGVFRTNCLDCLDRTNFVQDILGRAALEQYLFHVRREWINSGSLWTNHRELWAENGDALSKIYAGTGALNTSYTRSGKRTLAGVLSDATKSVSRAYINNFQDKGKQQAIDLFLGNLALQKPVNVSNPLQDMLRYTLAKRIDDYSTMQYPTIFVGTWNLNGRPPAGSILPWIFPILGHSEPDMLVLGFQEIVPLTAQQIVQTDPTKKAAWEKHILYNLQQRPNNRGEYVILRSEQLVGTALIVVVKAHLTSCIRNVEGASRKTGLRGMSGNKGAVGIRLDYYNTSFCFLTAHLAAGQDNVMERNNDYQTIVEGLQFLRGKTINSHENVVWLADTNYRIDLDNEHIRMLAKADEFDPLVGEDQLKKAMDSNAAFLGYQEGPLLFRPTYRYDLYSDEYDTSEKLRSPAWTDRILFRGKGLDLQRYTRAELKSSDHRPVLAIFRAVVHVIDSIKRESLSRILLDGLKHALPGERLDDKLAMIRLEESIRQLPPPSSDEAAWWETPDHPDGIVIVPSQESERLPKNPWDSASTLTTPSSSDEELYSNAISLNIPEKYATQPRKPPPPPPPPKTSKPKTTPP